MMRATLLAAAVLGAASCAKPARPPEATKPMYHDNTGRDDVLTGGVKRGRFRHGRRIGSFLWTVRISRADVAGFMLNQLSSDTYVRAAPGVCW